MLKFSCVIKGPDYGIVKRELNNCIRKALIAAAKYWIKYYLKKHFDPSAVQRYQYSSRSPRYLGKKRKVQIIRLPGGGTTPATQPPEPLVWTGDLKKSIFARSEDAYNIRATATSNKCFVKVPVPIPHPMNPRNAAELVQLNNEEMAKMHEIAITVFKVELEKAINGKANVRRKVA